MSRGPRPNKQLPAFVKMSALTPSRPHFPFPPPDPKEIRQSGEVYPMNIEDNNHLFASQFELWNVSAAKHSGKGAFGDYFTYRFFA